MGSIVEVSIDVNSMVEFSMDVDSMVVDSMASMVEFSMVVDLMDVFSMDVDSMVVDSMDVFPMDVDSMVVDSMDSMDVDSIVIANVVVVVDNEVGVLFVVVESGIPGTFFSSSMLNTTLNTSPKFSKTCSIVFFAISVQVSKPVSYTQLTLPTILLV